MARFFITGSSDGLGNLAARALIKRGHSVVLHARNQQRADDALKACPGAEQVLIADLAQFDEIQKLAEDANAAGPFDAVIHNAGLYRGSSSRNQSGIPAIAMVNSIAPYMLTALMDRPKRLVYVSSGLHRGGNADNLDDVTWQRRGDKHWSDSTAYADSKLHNILLANAVARTWPDVESNSLDPGWQPTKMGGYSASGNTDDAVGTYVYLAEGKNEATSKYYYSSKAANPVKEATDTALQDQYMNAMAQITKISFPGLN
jgi:NAD(P)-dependent dehydrogenase (short-subunit alcohol dehydrogenase family)